MTPDRFRSLSPRQRECLRGVRDLKAAGEIATELGISISTVNGYLADAVRHLGARNRREAALALARHESGDPENGGGGEIRVVPAASGGPAPASPEMVEASRAPQRGRFPRLPIRRVGEADNELTTTERLIWIPAIALGVAIGFGMLMTGLQIAAALIERVTGAFGR